MSEQALHDKSVDTTAEVLLALELKRKIKRWYGIFLVLVLYLLLTSCQGDNVSVDEAIAYPHIAKVTVDAVIESDKQPWYKQLVKVLDEPKVKALVLVLDSPGGVVHVAEASHSLLKRIRANGVPIVAVVKSQATSAAYLMASAADAIVAHETSIVGSIGVKSSIMIFKEMLDKLGVNVITNGVGQNLTGIPFTGISPFTKKYLDLTGKDSYTWFTSAVKVNRKLTDDRLDKVVGGKIFTGTEGLSLGLVDHIGDLQMAYSLLQDLYYGRLPAVVDYGKGYNEFK